MSEFRYPGGELDDFARARNWKAYWMAQVRPFLGARVLEVGAGIGANTALLCGPAQERWLCLEPDAALAERLRQTIGGVGLAQHVSVLESTIQALDADEVFDTVLYVDVLEHIEDDASELRAASAHLVTGGHLVVVSPAHPWLYSPFDEAIGHHRRYTRSMMCVFDLPGMTLSRVRYLDVAGLAASAVNRFLLRQSRPTDSQIAIWNRVLVPCSRVLDPLVAYTVGKSILAVWTKGSVCDG